MNSAAPRTGRLSSTARPMRRSRGWPSSAAAPAASAPRRPPSSPRGQGMAVAIVGLPAGLSLPEDFAQLKDKARPPADGTRAEISFWEVRGRELILYWRDLAPKQHIEVSLDLVCRLPGDYRGP